MNSFLEFVAEENKHEHGTYINVKPDFRAKSKLNDWVKLNGISNPLDSDEYHVTVIYSRNPCPGAAAYDFRLPISGSISGWHIFDSRLGRCLVAAVDSPELQRINSDLKANYGATSDFPDYKPHITVSYNYEGDMPTTHPEIQIQFNRVEVKALDPDWKPGS